MNIFKSFRFSLGKKRRRSRPKISAPAPAKILNRLQIQPKNLGSDRLRLRNTGNEELGSFYFKILCQHFFSPPGHSQRYQAGESAPGRER